MDFVSFRDFQDEQKRERDQRFSYSFADFQEEQQQAEASRVRHHDHNPFYFEPEPVNIPEAPPEPAWRPPDRTSYRPLDMRVGDVERALGQAEGIGSADSARGYYTPGGARSIFDAEEMLAAKEQAGTANRGYAPGGNPLGDAIIRTVGNSAPWQGAMAAFDVGSRISKDLIVDPVVSGFKGVRESTADGGGVIDNFLRYQYESNKKALENLTGGTSAHDVMQKGQLIHEAAAEKILSGELAPLPEPMLDEISRVSGVPRSPEFDAQISSIAWEVGFDALNLADFAGAVRATSKAGKIFDAAELARRVQDSNLQKMDDAWIRAQERAGEMPSSRPVIESQEPQGFVADRIRTGLDAGHKNLEGIVAEDARRNWNQRRQGARARAQEAAAANEQARTGFDLMEARAANEMGGQGGFLSFREFLENSDPGGKLRTAEEIRDSRYFRGEFQDDPGVAEAAAFQQSFRDKSPGQVRESNRNRLEAEREVQDRLDSLRRIQEEFRDPADLSRVEPEKPAGLEVVRRGNVRDLEAARNKGRYKTSGPSDVETPPPYTVRSRKVDAGEMPTFERPRVEEPEAPVPREYAEEAQTVSDAAESVGMPGQSARQIRSFDPDEIKVDAKTFQFKESGSEGLTERLRDVDQWDPVKGGVAVVYEARNGDVFIADGHQRVGLAKRLKDQGQEPAINAFVLREADGFTPADARGIAAAKNLAEDSGTALDAAKVIREMGPDSEVLQSLPRTSAVVRDGREVAKLGDEAFDMVVNRQVPAQHAAHVGRLIEDPAQQVGAMRALERIKPSNSRQAESIVRDVRESGFARRVEQGGLFGDEVRFEDLLGERAQIFDAAVTASKKDKKLFRSIVKGEGVFEQVGNKLARDANRNAATEAERILAGLEEVKYVGAVSEKLNELARQLKAGEITAAKAGRELVGTVKQESAVGREAGRSARRSKPSSVGGPDTTRDSLRLESDPEDLDRTVEYGGQLFAGQRPGGPSKPKQPKRGPQPPGKKAPGGNQGLGKPATAPKAATPAELKKATKSVQRITEEIQDSLFKLTGTRVSKAKMGRAQRNSAGVMDMVTNLIQVGGKSKLKRLGMAEKQLDIVAHEVGHALDRHFSLIWDASAEVSPELARMGKTGLAATADPRNSNRFLGPAVGNELKGLADHTRPGSMSSYRPGQPGHDARVQRAEGFAEFFRQWMLDPAAAQKAAPETYKAWEKFLDDKDDLGRMFRTHQADYKMLHEAPARAEMRAKMRDEMPGHPQTANDHIAAYVDRYRHFQALEEILEAAQGGKKLRPSERPYMAARMIAGDTNVLSHFLDRGGIRFADRKPTGSKSLREILEPVGKDRETYLDFREYMTARRAQELEARGIQSGFSKEAIDDALTNRLSDVPTEQMEKIAEEVYRWQDEVLQYALDGGFISKESFNRIKKLNRNYVPYHRIRNLGTGVTDLASAGGASKGLKPNNVRSLQAIRGSDADILDPFEAMVANLEAMVGATEKNRVGQILLKHAENRTPGIGEFVVLLKEPPMVYQKVMARDAVSARQLMKQLEEMGADFKTMGLTEKDVGLALDLLPEKTLAQLDKTLPPGVIRVKDKGETKFLHIVDEGMYRAFVGADEESVQRMVDMMQPMIAGANALRKGAVTLNPFFPINNVFRDIAGAHVLSGERRPLQRTINGASIMIQDFLYRRMGLGSGEATELVNDFFRQGGKQGATEMISSRGNHHTKLGNVLAAKHWTEREWNLTWVPASMRRKISVMPKLPKALRRGIKNGTALAASPFRLLEALGEASDDMVRLGEVSIQKKRLRLQHPDWTEAEINKLAAFEARNFLDFNQRGHHPVMRVARQVVPFLGSGMTGNYRVLEALAQSDVPGKAFGLPGKAARERIAVTAGTFTTFSMGLYAINRGNPEYWELPQEERDRFWHIPVPESWGGGFARIAKPHIVGTLFGSIPERLLAYMDGDQKWARGLTKTLWSNAGFDTHKIGNVELPMVPLPPLVEVFGELVANHDTFKGAPVDIYMKYSPDKAAYLRSSEYNSLTSRKLSEALHKVGVEFSPPQIEHTMRGLLGSSADNLIRGIDPGIGVRTPGTDDVLSWATGESKPGSKEKQWFGLKSAQKFSEAESRLKELSHELGVAKSVAEDKKTRFEQLLKYKQVKRAEAGIRERRSRLAKTTVKKEQERLRREIVDLARKALLDTEYALPG